MAQFIQLTEQVTDVDTTPRWFNADLIVKIGSSDSTTNPIGKSFVEFVNGERAFLAEMPEIVAARMNARRSPADRGVRSVTPTESSVSVTGEVRQISTTNDPGMMPADELAKLELGYRVVVWDRDARHLAIGIVDRTETGGDVPSFRVAVGNDRIVFNLSGRVIVGRGQVPRFWIVDPREWKPECFEWTEIAIARFFMLELGARVFVRYGMGQIVPGRVTELRAISGREYSRVTVDRPMGRTEHAATSVVFDNWDAARSPDGFVSVGDCVVVECVGAKE